ncbi:putative short-chain dehydrogenase [Aspergillus affinis]|uniref:putative short-chain dehydrogenase n=1 Tax=Aspergillus affinis TaxID=1070780 RepID=UPI0022FE5CEA|nr:putative short-chain dehydrogenase [Aspergillus affinis]KAI9037556.1 putative short-chain dehydrogenase [Aspergillus affinis]
MASNNSPSLSTNLVGKTAIVTGSSRGIGAAIGLELGRRGATVVITCSSEGSRQAAANVVDAIEQTGSKGKGILVRANITSATYRQELVDTAVAASPSGKIDILVHNAGDGDDCYLSDITDEFFDKQMGVNLKAPLFLTQAAVPHMSRGGRIVLITSAAARMGVAQTSVYAATKAGMESFARVWATELGQSKGITVNCVSPSPIATDQFHASAAEFKEALQPMIESTPAEARIVEVYDIAPLVSFLCSEESRTEYDLISYKTLPAAPAGRSVENVIGRVHPAKGAVSKDCTVRDTLPDKRSLDPIARVPHRRSKRSVRKPVATEQQAESASSKSRNPGISAETTIGDLLEDSENQDLLLYFDKTVCNALVIDAENVENLFRSFILPLAYRSLGILHAVLALSSCHAVKSGSHKHAGLSVTTMIEHQLSALQSLSSLLLKEELSCLAGEEEDIILATVLLLVLHDVCESGISSHGVHLTGAGFVCGKLCHRPEALASPRITFLLSALVWLDVLRGFSGAEKMTYSDSVRQFILETEYFSFETLVGCPVELLYNIGGVLAAAKEFMNGSIGLDLFQATLDEAETFFGQ